MNRFLTKDFLAGLMFFGFGALAYLVAFGDPAVFGVDIPKFFGQTRLPLGTPVRMGPGFVPQALAFIMMGLGAIIAILALVSPSERVEDLHWKPIVMITLGVVAFGALLEPSNVPAMVSWFVSGLPRWENPVAGMLPALVVLVFLAALGGDEFHLLETIGMCVVLTFICYSIFKLGLGMNITTIAAFPQLDTALAALGIVPFTAIWLAIVGGGGALAWYRQRQQGGPGQDHRGRVA